MGEFAIAVDNASLLACICHNIVTDERSPSVVVVIVGLALALVVSAKIFERMTK